jgi:trimethylamine--corrinoid protein Co-methyltransferase
MSVAEDRGERHGREPASGPIRQMPWGQPRRPFPPMEIVSADELEAIHLASLQVLEEIGMEVMLPEARDIFARAGASVEGERVRIGRDIIEAAMASAPAEFQLHARNPEHSVTIGGDWIAFCPVGGPPNCSDLDRGRRPGTLADSSNFMRLAQVFNCIHIAGGGAVEAIDVHSSIRHLVVHREKIRLSDKVPFVSSLGLNRVRDGMEMARIARGVGAEQFDAEPSCYTVVNTNSPLKLDLPMAMGIIEMARAGQMVCVTPFTLAGAMAPVTIAGALVEQNAEALVGLSLTQLVRQGAPCVYGGFTSNVDMKSGAPAFGTPEYMKAAIVGGQLARRYNVAYRTSSTNAANAVDAQSAYETVFSLWGAIMGGGNFIIHAAGWMEGGLVASYEKFALDIELLQIASEFLKPVALPRQPNAFEPLISDWRNHRQWAEAGRPEAARTANRLWKQALAEHECPALDPAIAEELDAFVARRIAQGGEPTDF